MQKNRTSNPLRYLFGQTWRYSEGSRGKVVCFWTMFIIANSISLIATPLIWAKIIDTITKQGITRDNIKSLFFLLGMVLLTDFVFWCFHGPGRIMECINAFKVRANYRKFLLKGIMALPMGWHVEHHTGDSIDKVEKGANALFSFSEDTFGIIYAIIELVISFLMVAYFSSISAGIVFCMVLLAFWIIVRFDRVLIGQYKELNHSENSISESIFDAISNITTVVILRVEKIIFKSIAKKIDGPFELFKRNVIINESKWFLINMCCVVMTVLVLVVYFLENTGTAKGILVGSVYLLINYLNKLSELFFKFTSMYGEVLQHKAKVMNSEELTNDFRNENPSEHTLPSSWESIVISNLNFSYHNGDVGELHLENICLEIKRGKRMAFIGKTGCGKTTLLKVMRELYVPRTLSLAVDGQRMENGFGSISQDISLIPQDPELFATSIIRNITMGADYDVDYVRRFTDMACFTEVAEKLPRGFDTSIKEKGVNLSGGQRLRLALARGLLASHDKNIVLLDEPTSSLDASTEKNVYRNILDGLGGKTIISTVHRLHLLPLFDTICLFDGGRIIASGTLEYLLATSPDFQELWQKNTVTME